jgi:eukaryotic-like serine/threonine-protein kinase
MLWRRRQETREEVTGQPRRGPLLWPWFVLLLLVVGGLIAAAILLTRDDDKSTSSRPEPPAPSGVTVPRVAGLTEAAAKTRLHGLGFSVDVSRIPSTKAEGIVVSQDPAQGSTAARGSIVEIDVSQGPRATTETTTRTVTTTTTTTAPTTTSTTPLTGSVVPRVVGMGQGAAMTRLERAGFRAESFPVASSRTRGLVVSQRPGGGAHATPRAVVRLSVALGSGARPMRVVPDAVGMTEADAKRVLVRVGFTVRALEPAAGITSRGDVVVEQKPGADARVRAGSQVLIYLGPAQ